MVCLPAKLGSAKVASLKPPVLLVAKYPLWRGFSCGSNITQETRELGEKPLAFMFILIPSVGPHSEEIITLDSAYTLVIGIYKKEKRREDNNEENISPIVK